MGAYYTLFGRQVASHYLVLATYATLGFGIYGAKKAFSGNKTEEEIQRSTMGEEETAFVDAFMKAVQAEDK